MLQHVLDLATDAHLAPVVVVLGADADEIEFSCAWHDELRVRNHSPAAGISGTVRLGLSTVSRFKDARRAVVLLGDQPFLSLEQLGLVLAAEGQVVVPRYSGKVGNPVVLERSIWLLAARLEGDRGFSQVFSAYPNLVTFVDVPGSNPDIDTVVDLNLRLQQGSSGE